METQAGEGGAMMPVRFSMVANAAEPSRAGLEKAIARWAPRPLDPADLHVRRFVAANSAPSRDDVLRITKGGIEKLAGLYPGAAVMRNHGIFSSQDMPIGTVFAASTRMGEKDTAELILDFYLARHDEMGDAAARYIDLGIWKEGSIHAVFARTQCSICGRSLNPEERGACRDHEPGEEYDGQLARVELDDPLEAPEFSLCWSGRLEGTRALSRDIPGTVTASRFLEDRRSWIRGLSSQSWVTTIAGPA